MVQMNLSAQWSFRNGLLAFPATKLRTVLLDGVDLLGAHPEILVWIGEDLDRAALAKKELRQADRHWSLAHGVELLGFDDGDWEQTSGAVKVDLRNGRPRLMDAHCNYMFLLLRGYFGSVGSQEAQERLRDSSVVQAYLEWRGLGLPGESTIRENLNAISNQTRDLIVTAQLEQVLHCKLDDFRAITIDSTAVKANSAWPTDSKMLLGLLNRVSRCGQQLAAFSLPDFHKHHSKRWLNDLDKLDFQIALTLGKANSKGKIKKHYRKFLETCGKLLEHFTKEWENLDERCRALPLPPSRRRLLERLWNQIHDDLRDVATVCSYATNRIFNDVVLPAPQKILSLSDRSAAFIKKGQRNHVIGYKPQLCRSANGFITALVIDEGNPADSSKLVPTVEQHIGRTGIVPTTVSADDGYSSMDNRKMLLDLDVAAVSLSGAKGKKLTPEDEWNSQLYQQLRKDRSAVESLMFIIKYAFHFRQLTRRGLEDVTAEMLEKAIVYNLWRMSHVRKKEAEAA